MTKSCRAKYNSNIGVPISAPGGSTYSSSAFWWSWRQAVVTLAPSSFCICRIHFFRWNRRTTDNHLILLVLWKYFYISTIFSLCTQASFLRISIFFIGEINDFFFWKDYIYSRNFIKIKETSSSLRSLGNANRFYCRDVILAKNEIVWKSKVHISNLECDVGKRSVLR